MMMLMMFCTCQGHTLTAVPKSTQPSTLHGTVKWVSAYELSNTNKWWWCLRMVAANLSADWQPKSVGLVWGLAATRRSQSAFIKWTGWTLAMTMSWWQHHKHCRWLLLLLLLLLLYDLDLWPLSWKTFSAMATHMVNICDKFQWNSSTCRDITSCETGVNG